MATVLRSMKKGFSNYPIPLEACEAIADDRGLTLSDEITDEIRNGKAFKLARADIFKFVALAPDIQQGGQSYSIPDDTRDELMKIANKIYARYEGTGSDSSSIEYGFKGSRL